MTSGGVECIGVFRECPVAALHITSSRITTSGLQPHVLDVLV